ncbi:MAG TPA: hypothetical protein ENG70_01345 [Candidatus Cloacimonetes bacterium]|nr:hypothetical protein [Candidatus Cloacimonadota bacterium]HEX37494.1 hypothetical protein [Candidatus Cloacimonadota bacterium]
MKKSVLVILMLVLSVTYVFAQSVEVDFIPPEFVESLKPLNLRLDIISGGDKIEEVYLFYKKGNLDFTQELMEPGLGINQYYQTTIPGRYIDQAISFYFRLILKDGLDQTIPATDPINNPYYVPLRQKEKPKKDAYFQILSPDQEYNYQDKDFMVAISYFSLEDKLQDKSIVLYFDGRDVTADATIANNMLVYKPAAVGPGNHTIRVAVLNKDDSIFKEMSWTVQVKKVTTLQKLSVSVNGDLVIDSRLTLNDGDSSSFYFDKDKEWRSTGQLRLWGGKDWFRYRGRVYVSSEESSKRQPYNRYSLDLHMPHLSLYFGDHNQVFSNTTIAGKNVRGIGGELTFGFFKLHSFYGQIQRHIKGTQIIDSTTVPYDTTYTGGYYNRNSLGVRMQFGNERTFYVGLNALKTKDDIDSEAYAENPKDNVVVGLDSRLNLFRSRLQFGWEVSTSLLNNNIAPGVLTKEDMDSLDIDLPFNPEDIESIFIINEFVEPYKPSLSSIAAETYLRAFFMHNLLNFKYSYVGASYNSLANPYLQKDKSGFNIMDNITLMNNQLNFGIGYHAYKDNLRDTKEATTHTKGYRMNAGYYPFARIPNISLSYQKTNITKEVSDSTLFPANRLSDIITFSTSYKFPVSIFSPTDTRIVLSFSNTNTTDKEFNTYDYNTQNYRFNVISEFKELPMTTRFNMSYFARKDAPDTLETKKSNYFNVGISEEIRPNLFKKGNFRTSLGYNWTRSTGDNKYTKHYITWGMYNQFKILPTDTFLTLELSYMIYDDSNDSAEDYNQMRGILKFTQKF